MVGFIMSNDQPWGRDVKFRVVDMDTPEAREARKVRDVSDLELVDWGVALGRPVLSVMEVGRRNVGMGVEPRLEVYYDVTYGSGERARNTALLVLDKDERSVAVAYLRYRREVLS